MHALGPPGAIACASLQRWLKPRLKRRLKRRLLRLLQRLLQPALRTRLAVTVATRASRRVQAADRSRDTMTRAGRDLVVGHSVKASAMSSFNNRLKARLPQLLDVTRLSHVCHVVVARLLLVT